jgi:rhodanese-related sulfurtransferase
MTWIACLLMAGVPAAEAGDAPPAITQAEVALATLTVDQVDAKIAAKTPGFFVFDVNPREVFDAGHLPTATWLPFNGVTADNLPADKTATLVFYCANVH